MRDSSCSTEAGSLDCTLLEAVVNVSDQLSARRELSLDVSGEILLRDERNAVKEQHILFGAGLGLDILFGAEEGKEEKTAAVVFRRRRRTEPLKVRKVLTSSSSEKKGCRATRLMNLPSARLLPSMNSRSETEVSTVGRRERREEEEEEEEEEDIVLDEAAA
ncbi:hypothetical protein EYF80_021741 [Liparis tanakae]|uniref:Uncharacterized protein n=1 Tax=Liparis tanakae TaxID=230148 RepID=A0A4Z2HQH6_9TELE|nr:hypothetical protein EYF80_021741 [Liparis tanakae]